MDADIVTHFKDLLNCSGANFTTAEGTHFFNLHADDSPFEHSMFPVPGGSEWRVFSETQASLETFIQICDYLKKQPVYTTLTLDYEPDGQFIVSDINFAEGMWDVEHGNAPGVIPRQLSFNLFWNSASSPKQTADDGSFSDLSQDDESCATKDGSIMSATQSMGTLSLGANTNPSEQ